jgi:hypothetical protein
MGWDGMGRKNLRPMGRDDDQVPSHPMGRFSKELHPMGLMGWNGMGWDCPIPRGALVYIRLE